MKNISCLSFRNSLSFKIRLKTIIKVILTENFRVQIKGTAVLENTVAGEAHEQPVAFHAGIGMVL